MKRTVDDWQEQQRSLTTSPGSVDGSVFVMDGKRGIAEFFGYFAEENARLFINAWNAKEAQS